MLSREQILAMEPGRELDKLVAIHVMGYSMYHYDKDVEENCYYMLVDDELDPVAEWESYNIRQGERKSEEEAWRDCPKYSESISSAWEVVGKMRKTHWVDISGGLKLELVSPYTCQIGTYGVPGSLYAEGDTAPEAICKASLLAVIGI